MPADPGSGRRRGQLRVGRMIHATPRCCPVHGPGPRRDPSALRGCVVRPCRPSSLGGEAQPSLVVEAARVIRSAVGGGVMGAPLFGSFLFGSLRGYRRGWLRADLVAGLAVWAVLVPESLAYAVLAGVPPVVGLWAAPAALVLYAALGSSRHLVVGPMSATAALSGVVVGGLAGDPGRAAALTAGLALVTGIITIGAGLLRLGFLAGFVSQPVLKGFIIGLALTIVAGQLPKLFGVERVDGVFYEKVWGLSTRLGETNGWAVAVGAGSLALLLLLRRFAPLVPSAMVVVLAGVGASVLLELPERGVAVVGSITSGLPPF